MTERIRAALAARMKSNELPGYVAVVAGPDDEWVDVAGVTAFGGGTPMERDTPFRIASTTKPIMAAVAMTLVEDGTLRLDQRVDELLPELADRRVLTHVDGPLDDTVPARRPITVEDVLTYRMGHGLIFEPYDPDFPIVNEGKRLELTLAEPDPRTPHPPDEWIRRFGTLPLMSQPGEEWQYNTAGAVLGVLISRAAGGPLADVAEERLLGPLGMRSTGFHLPTHQAARLPALYLNGEPRPGSTKEEWSSPPVFPSAAAGLASTADDLLRFGRMMLAGGGPVLSRESVAAMTTNHLTDAQIVRGGVLLDGSGWGYGLSVTEHEYGWPGGYGTFWCNVPAKRRVGILLTQTADVLWNGTLTEFTRALID
ncbi:serine hydrolase domain-containing protein [Catenuloplanes sp. NPDC051500]|uniref:serine hydrolase domain-containing protein n=1 Tax=Catenuloplanes sp. NPDC051500 TaxID=3363959 RepID=UPI0037ACCCBE